MISARLCGDDSARVECPDDSAADGLTCDELPTLTSLLDFPKVEPGTLRIDVNQLTETAGQWSALGAELGVRAVPSSGNSFQPTTAAVSSVQTAVGFAAAVLTSRTQATTSAVEAGAAGYVNNEVTCAAELAAVPQDWVV